MSFVLCEKKDLVALADKIRESTGSTNGLTFGEIVNNYGGGASDSGGTGCMSIKETALLSDTLTIEKG